MNLLHELISSPWFIEKGYADDHFHLALRLLKGDFFVDPNITETDKSSEMLSQANISFLNAGKPFTIDAYDLYHNADQLSDPSLFILNISGPITKHSMFCGPVGMNHKSDWLKKADMHPLIFAHVIKLDSGGGSGYAARVMSETISNLQKPVFAFIDDYGASAAYWIAAEACHIAIGSDMGMAGSIGTYLTLRDYSDKLKKEGIVEVDVYAEMSSQKNIELRLLREGKLESAIARAQSLANKFNDHFLNHVIKSRSNKLKSNEWNNGSMFFASDAKSIGLIDEIISWDDYLQKIFDEFCPKI